MIWLIPSILCFAATMLLFKQFSSWKIDNIPAITVNYFVAAFCGLAAHLSTSTGLDVFKPFLPYAAVIGVLFIVLFNLIALAAQRVGVSAATVSNKMSVVIPVMAAVWLYNDSIGWLKIIGILLALIAVYLTVKTPRHSRLKKGDMILVLVIFVGSGILDVVFNHAAQKYVAPDEKSLFVTTAFLIAGTIGLLYSLTTKAKFSKRNILGGIAVGVPNYACLLFFLMALDSGAESSRIFPINNMGIVAASALGAFVIFKERLTLINWLGIVTAIVAISIIAFETLLLDWMSF